MAGSGVIGVHMSATDRYRQAVYHAEDQWSAILDRGGTVDFFGSTITVPVQMKFSSLGHVKRYVAHVCRSHGIPEPGVRHRRGGTRAHYEVREDGAVIAIPSDEPWAMRESVVLHEISHHACSSKNGTTDHDAQFAATMLSIVHTQLGLEAELLLRTGYHSAGVPT